MIIDVKSFILAIAIGIGATFIVDMWNLFIRHAFNIRSLDNCLLGRWISHMPKGKFIHLSINNAQKMPYECLIGLIAHYSIGVILAIAFVLIVPGKWLDSPTFFPALIYGITTIVFPLFIMQPSLGLGMASSKTSNPALARLKSLMTHTVFGSGLWLCAILMRFFCEFLGICMLI